MAAGSVRPLTAPGDLTPRGHALARFHPSRLGLAARTALVMLAVLATVQGLGLAVHAQQETRSRRMLADRYVGIHVMTAYRTVLDTPPPLRPAELARIGRQPNVEAAALSESEPPGLPPASLMWHRGLRFDLNQVPMPRAQRPTELAILPSPERVRVAMQLADGSGWLDLILRRPSPGVLDDPTFLTAWLLMTATAAALIVWAIGRLTRPFAVLAEAADALGRDVNAPPLPENGPLELARAAQAFNTMASRIRRFVTDRTFVLTALGHDLRTPITRLKLRCEFIDDEEVRARFLSDLDELEAMVASTLAYGRDTARAEPAAPLDLGALLRTVADEAGDARPAAADRITVEINGPAVIVRGRPIALKRCLANLVANALAYGGSAALSLVRMPGPEVTVLIEDDGPGIPPDDLERVFEPFRRLETSRSRETGGTGLGLPIARDIVRAHGGDIALSNRAGGGLRARIVLPL